MLMLAAGSRGAATAISRARLTRRAAAMASAASASPAAAPPQRKHVVTAFVQRPTDGAVLLVLRSDKVGTYKHMWGAVSGGIEGEEESPVFRAEQEIMEEAGLQRSQMRLVRSGRPLIVDDGRLHFAVHPFLFCLEEQHADVAVKLNWENDDAKWVAPAGIRQLDAVPLLAETYERVNLSATQAAAMQQLADDRQHGAAQLARWAVEALRQDAQQLAAAAQAGGGSEDDGGAALDSLRNFGYHMACCRPSMAAIANSLAAVLAATHERLQSRADAFGAPVGEVCAMLQQAASAEEQRLAAAAAQIRQHVAALLRDGMCLMTCSLSSSVLAAVKEAAESGMKLRAIVCESRPLCEGVQLAAAWAEAGVECTVITDAQMGLFVGQADLVLIGADALTHNAAINKAGSHLLALAAQAAGVPVYCAADSGKLSPGPLFSLAHPGRQQVQQQQFEEKEAAEVTATWAQPVPQGVAVRNIYFEAVPLPLLTGVVTEDGTLDSNGIGKAVKERKRQYRMAFQLP